MLDALTIILVSSFSTLNQLCIYNETLDTTKLDLANKSASYISQLENISRRAAKTFEAAEKRVLNFTERHVWLTLAFCGSLIGHLIGCIQWIQTLF